MTMRPWQAWSTRTRLLVITIAPVVAMCLTLVWYSYQSRQQEVRAALASRGQLLARVLADSSEAAIGAKRYDSLQRTVRDVLQSDTSIWQVALFDAHRRPLLRLQGHAGGGPETRYYEAPVVKRVIWIGTPGAAPQGMTTETVGYLQVRMAPAALLQEQARRFHLELLVACAGLLLCGTVAFRLSQGFDTSLQGSLRALREADAEKRQLLRRVNTAVEEERRSIALEIHDELNAVLIAARLEAQRIAVLARDVQPAEAAEDIGRRAQTIAKLALGLYNSGRALVRRLRPEVLDMLGLRGAVEEMVRQADAGATGCRFDIATDGEFADVAPEVAITAYRVIQEALSNVVKHAVAGHASVSLARRGERLHIEVIDDGRGLDAAQGDPARQAGIGIAGMRERVQALAGSFTIASDSTGTRVAIELPLQPS
jgi:two-component system, NarL family, sensor histidine kinase UhpB